MTRAAMSTLWIELHHDATHHSGPRESRTKIEPEGWLGRKVQHLSQAGDHMIHVQ